MRAALFAAVAAGLGFAAASGPAAAYDYPYCLQGRQTGYPGECSYRTYEQCQASASGRLATCGINPRVAAQQQRYEGRRPPPRYRGYEQW